MPKIGYLGIVVQKHVIMCESTAVFFAKKKRLITFIQKVSAHLGLYTRRLIKSLTNNFVKEQCFEKLGPDLCQCYLRISQSDSTFVTAAYCKLHFQERVLLIRREFAQRGPNSFH